MAEKVNTRLKIVSEMEFNQRKEGLKIFVDKMADSDTEISIEKFEFELDLKVLIKIELSPKNSLRELMYMSTGADANRRILLILTKL